MSATPWSVFPSQGPAASLRPSGEASPLLVPMGHFPETFSGRFCGARELGQGEGLQRSSRHHLEVPVFSAVSGTMVARVMRVVPGQEHDLLLCLYLQPH